MMILQEDTEFLEHFGVKGMKWGVRNEERTVRKQERNTQKIEKKKSQSDDVQKKIDAIDNSTATRNHKKRANAEKRVELVEKQKALDKAAKDIEQGKLTDRQKKVIKGVAITGAVIAAYGAYTMVQSGETNRLLMKGSSFVNKTPIFKTKDSLTQNMGVNEIMTSVVKPINPGYGGIGTKVNCRRCTFAYEARRRGLDVAATRTSNSRGQDFSGLYNAVSPGESRIKSGRIGLVSEVIQENFRANRTNTGSPFSTAISTWDATGKVKIPKAKGLSLVDEDSIFKSLLKNPNGARGELGVQWSAGGGHSMAWEIVGGRPVIFDAQSGKKFLSGKDLLDEFGAISIKDAGYTRLDNLPLNEDFLLRWLKDA